MAVGRAVNGGQHKTYARPETKSLRGKCRPRFADSDSSSHCDAMSRTEQLGAGSKGCGICPKTRRRCGKSRTRGRGTKRKDKTPARLAQGCTDLTKMGKAATEQGGRGFGFEWRNPDRNARRFGASPHRGQMRPETPPTKCDGSEHCGTLGSAVPQIGI